MGFWDVVTGRSRPKPAKLDSLFSVPDAGITLQTELGLVATGDGAVCYRAAVGPGFASAEEELLALLRGTPSAPEVTTSQDSYGYTWLVVDHEPLDPQLPDLSQLCTDLHAVNSTLEAQGYGPGLLCSLVPFTSADGRRVGLVYLYKQGTFYPFAPLGGAAQQRDNLLELQARDALADELPIEPELSRWLALWDAPGL
jgi:hypothetical protein